MIIVKRKRKHKHKGGLGWVENGKYVKSAKLLIIDVLRLDHVDEMQCAIEARKIMSKNILTNQN